MSLHACSNTIEQNDLLSSPEKQRNSEQFNMMLINKDYAGRICQNPWYSHCFSVSSSRLVHYSLVLPSKAPASEVKKKKKKNLKNIQIGFMK